MNAQFSKRFRSVLLAALASLLPQSPVLGQYLFQAPVDIPETPAASFTSNGCSDAPLPRLLTLEDAVNRGLCASDRTRLAWIQVKQQAAVLIKEKSSYLPTMQSTISRLGDNQLTHVPGHPELSSHNVANTVTENLQLNWLLYDFGARHDRVTSAEYELVAARAAQDVALRMTFAETSRLYLAAQAADGALTAARDIEQRAVESLEAATTRVLKGVAPISDEYQAKTALLSAQLSRLHADSDHKLAVSSLLQELRAASNTEVALSKLDAAMPVDVEFSESVEDLTRLALLNNADINRDRAHLRAAEMSAQAVENGGWPSLSLSLNGSRNNQPVSPLPGEPLFRANARDVSVQLQISVPLFEGFSRKAESQYQHARIEQQRAVLDATQSDVEFSIARDYQYITLTSQECRTADDLLSTAADAAEAAKARYVAGVGNITEVLSAQTAIATAMRQRLQSIADWNVARFKLGADLGQLSTSQLH